MSIKLVSTSGGSVTIQEPNTASDFTLSVPAQNGTVVATDASGNVGIGTSSPVAKLQAAGTSGSPQFRAGTASNGYVEINAFDSNPVYCVIGGSNATAGVFGTQSNIPTIFFTNNTERMRIDSSGRVTTPYQPAFSGYRTAGNVSSPTTVVHNQVFVNVGSCYNTSTGIFTCPIAGYYEVFAGGHAEGSQPTVIQIQLNGVTQTSEYQNGAAYGSATATAILSCAANDQIKSVVGYGTFWGGDNSGLRMTVKLIG